MNDQTNQFGPEQTTTGQNPSSPTAAVRGENKLMTTTPRPAVVMSQGRGSWLTDSDGIRYLDFLQGWAVNSLGHCPPSVVQAVREQSDTLLSPSPAFHNAPQLRLAQQLCDATSMHQVTFSLSGAEANETAVKLARKWGQKHRAGAGTIVTTHGSFHGRTLAMMAASGKPGFSDIFPPRMPGFVHAPYGDTEAIRSHIDDGTVAIMVEPIQGEAGVVVPPAGYLADLRKLADEYELLLIADEIQTGCGRTGYFLAQEHDEVRADITTLGKGLGGGVAVSATLCNRRAACFEPGDHGGTHCGNPLAMAAASAVVDVLTGPEFLSGVRERGDELRQALQRVCPAVKGRVRGRGLLLALDTNSVDTRLWAEQALWGQKLLVNGAHRNVLRLSPALNVTGEEIQQCERRLLAAARTLA